MCADLYDYDGTICPGDTGSAFWLYCLVRRPYIAVFMPIQLIGALLYLFGVHNAFSKRLNVYCFLRAVNAPKLAQRFAQKRVRKTFPYFLDRDRSRPVVVCSASPTFLLKPICDALGVQALVATDYDPKTGVLRSRTCKNEEKVRMLHEALPDVTFDRVYSDSLRHDIHILRLGKTAYRVVRGEPQETEI